MARKNIFQKILAKFNPKKVFSNKKKTIFIIVSVICLLSIIVFGIMGYIQMNKVSDEKQKLSKEIIRANDTNNTIASAQTLANTGKIDEAKVVYEKAAEKTDDKYQKSILILSKAILFFNAGDDKNALITAKQAESIDRNSEVALFIAQVYEKEKEYKKAIDYYQITIDVMDKSKPMADADVKYYQSKIEVLAKL